MPADCRNTLLDRMRLYVLLTQAHCRLPLVEACRLVIRGGADVVQLREKSLADSECLRLARDLRAMTAAANVGFILNDRPDLARLADADGCHVGQDDIPPQAARKVLASDQILGVSTHSTAQAGAAVRDGADYIGVGPVYPTATRGYDQGVGCAYVAEAARCVHVPLVAIGGITPERVPEVIRAAGGRPIAIAVCSAILGADDIELAARRFREAIDSAPPSNRRP